MPIPPSAHKNMHTFTHTLARSGALLGQAFAYTTHKNAYAYKLLSCCWPAG